MSNGRPPFWPRVFALLSAVLLCGLLPAAWAQTAAPDTVLRTGDVLFIALPGENSLNQEFSIDRQGRIWIPEIGSMTLAGLSLQQGADSVRGQLTRFFRDLNGYEFSLRRRRLLLQVLGHVQNPGEYELADGSDIQTAIAAAGGLRNGAQLDRIQIRRGDQRLYVDYKSYLNTGEIQKLPALRTLDAVFVPISPLTGNVQVEFDSSMLLARGDSGETADAVSVFGQVRSPGSYTYKDGDNLIHYLLKAGGVNNFADVGSIRVIAQGGPKMVSLTEFLDSGDMGLLPVVSPGTTIFVPLLSEDADTTDHSQGVSIFGQVQAPGRYPHEPGRSVLDYLLQAGGVNNFAGVENIRIITAGEPVLFNLTEYLDTGEATRLPAVAAGATIFVPVKVDKMQSGSRVVYVMGEVFSPGAFEVQDQVGFLDVLANAGGPTRFAETRQLRILRADGSVLPFDLAAYTEGTAETRLPDIRAGDAIFVPEKANQTQPSWLKTPPTRAIKILGAVNSPGRYPWSDEMSLLDLLGQAGGPSTSADKAKLRIIPGGVDAGQAPFVFNLEDFIEQGEKLTQPLLRAGYTVIMPELPDSPIDNKQRWVQLTPDQTIYIIGEVGLPGRYAFNEQMSFLDILAAANGPTPDADLENIRVTLRRPEGARTLSFDLNAYLESGDNSLLPPVRTGDVILLTSKNSSLDSLNIIGGVNQPGRIDYARGMNLIDALALAGGPNSNGDLARILIVPGRADSALPSIEFNLETYRQGGISALPAIGPGDTILIPELPEDDEDEKTNWIQLQAKDAIYILGEVGTPGRYAFDNTMSFLDILAAADGPTADADYENIQISHRRNGRIETRSFNLSEYMRQQDDSLLPKVRTGDLILLPSEKDSSTTINVIGSVVSPGRVDFRRGMNLIDVLALAGGQSPEGDVAHIIIVPGAESPGRASVEFNLQDYQRRGESALPTIAAGDTVIMPALPEDEGNDNKAGWIRVASENSIYIIGEVGEPGRYAFDNSMHFLDILAAADGPTANADFENIRITYRRDGRSRTETFNLSEYMLSGDDSLLPRVQTGDLIMVPSEEDSSSTINVIGAVVRPGRVDYSQGMNLIDALALAGGQNDSADVASIIVVPGEESPGRTIAEFDLEDYRLRGESALPAVGPGDTLIVPELPDEDAVDNKSRWVRLATRDAIYVLGAVGEPGRYAFNDKMDFLDILSAADGPIAEADYENIKVTYRRAERSWTESFNLLEYMMTGNESLLPAVRNGDLIFVPTEDDSEQTVNVIGEVNQPGRIDYSLGMNVIDIIALAGGHTRLADTAHIRVIADEPGERMNCLRGHSCREFDLKNFEKLGEVILPKIGPGYTVIVPALPDDPNDDKARWVKLARERSIYVMGAVNAPGRYAFNDDLHFLDILTAAEGPSPGADLHNIRVSHRNGRTSLVSEVNLALYFETGDEHLLPDVRPQDVIYVPERGRQWLDISKESTVRVLGAVRDPGRYEFNSDMTVLDLLAEAGGTENRADVHSILIITRSVGGNVSRRFDLRDFAGTGEFGDLPVVRAGDTIYVPSVDDSPWQQFMVTVRDILSIVSIIAIVAAL